MVVYMYFIPPPLPFLMICSIKEEKQQINPKIKIELLFFGFKGDLEKIKKNGAKIISYFPLQQTQIPDYAELIVKFLDALIDTYLPGIDEETSEESLLTPTSPYPPAVQSQLSITANLNLSNSMTSLATSQHSPGQ